MASRGQPPSSALAKEAARNAPTRSSRLHGHDGSVGPRRIRRRAAPIAPRIAAAATRALPLLIIAGGAESLLSGAELLAEHARAAGVETQSSVYPEQPHGWLMLPKLPASIDAADEIRTWFLARLAG